MISITNLQRSIPIPASKIKIAAFTALKRLKLQFPEFSIVFAGPKRMRRINREYLGHDYATDVITFDYGEIIICPALAKRNARRFGNSVEKELVLYVVHGILHLAGYDDHAPGDAKKMRKKEVDLLGLFPSRKGAGL